MTLAMERTFLRAAEASAVLSRTRMRVREPTVDAIRGLEEKLAEALGGEQLRGLPNLVPSWARSVGAKSFHGLRVNAWGKRSGELPEDGREVLVLTTVGRLQVASLHDGNEVIVREAKDDELIAEDVEHFARIVQEALERHIAKSEERTAQLVRAEDLARKIVAAIGLTIR